MKMVLYMMEWELTKIGKQLTTKLSGVTIQEHFWEVLKSFILLQKMTDISKLDKKSQINHLKYL